MCSSTPTNETAAAKTDAPQAPPSSSEESSTVLKVDEEHFIQGANLARVWKKWKKLHVDLDDCEMEGNNITTTFSTLRPTDVLFGRGPRCAMRASNSLVRRALIQNREFYHFELQKHEKRVASIAMVKYFQAHGLRFVEQAGTDGRYVVAPNERVVGKIQQCIREFSKTSSASHGQGSSVMSNAKEQEARSASPSSSLKFPACPDKDSSSKTSSPSCKIKPLNLSSALKAKQLTAQINSTKARWRRRLLGSIRVGDRLGIYWPLDKAYYPCRIVQLSGTRAHVDYDDGDSEELDLAQHDFILCKKRAIAQQQRRPTHPPEHTDQAGLEQPAEDELFQ